MDDTEKERTLHAAAQALIAEYRKIWPGSWPAVPEALRLAVAALRGAGVGLVVSDEIFSKKNKS